MRAQQVILASTSVYRRELLQRLRLPFMCQAPLVDETGLSGESCKEKALRLGAAKADAVAQLNPHAWVIGSDQVADLHGAVLSKPGTKANAKQQLLRMCGQTVFFHTALASCCVHAGFAQQTCETVAVHMRHYSEAEIDFYLTHENALDCAGAAKSEGLGIMLIERIECRDTTALVGLPLMALLDLFAVAQIDWQSLVAVVDDKT